MAFKALVQEEDSSSSQLPLVRNYCKEEIKKGNDPYEEPLELRKIAVSKSEEWLVAETDVCTALIPSQSSLGSALLGIIRQLKGEGNALVLVPKKGGKLGFTIGVDDEQKHYYNWHEDGTYLNIARTKVKAKPQEPLLKLDDIIPPLPEHPSTDKATAEGGVKPKNERRLNKARTAQEAI